MAVERRDPVPPGRYWVFILPKEEEQWARWVTANQATVRVVGVERKEKLEPYVPAIFATRPDLSIIMQDGGAWLLFDILQPTPWVGLGFPTIVNSSSVKSSSQVEQGEVVPSQGSGPADFATKIALGAAPWLLGAYLGVQLIKRALR